ncbi:MAG: type II toxin-antitoxin system RelE/ParE family toxin [Blastocatellia bacterium]
MKIEFLAAAREEFLNAVSYYDLKKQGPGDEFYDEVWRTISRIVSHPFAWQPISSRTRRCRTKRFPYAVISSEVRFDTDYRRHASPPRPRELEG